MALPVFTAFLHLALAAGAVPTVGSPPAPKITITFPREGDVVPEVSWPVIEGTAIATAPVTVDIFGLPALVDSAHAGTEADPYRWSLRLPRPGKGSVPLTATVTARNGKASATTTLTIFGREGIELRAEHDSPISASRKVRIEYRIDSESELVKVEWSPDGSPGKFVEVAPPRSEGSLETDVAPPALTTSILRATTSTGVFEGRIAVQRIDGGKVVKEALGRWSELRKAMIASDLEAASGCFHSARRDRYRKLLGALGKALREAGESMGELKCDDPIGELADGLVCRATRVQTIQGKPQDIVYPIRFGIDTDGSVRIVEY